MENPSVKPECQQAPDNPKEGEKFTCPGCGYESTYLITDQLTLKGEWM